MKHIIICLLTLFACQSYAQDQNKPDSLKLDSLQKAFDRQQTGAEGDCIKTAINICMALYDSPGGFLIPDYAAKGLRACGGKKDTLSIQNSQTLLGILGAWYLRQGKYTDAADQYNLMRSIGGINPDQMVLARSYNGLGLANYYLRNFEKSVDYYRKALPCVGNNSTRLGKLYQNLANSFVELKEIDSALVYYYKALPSVLEENKDPAISIQYMNIALAYLKQNNPQEFIKNIEIALDYAKKAKSPYHIASIYQRMGDNFAMSGSSELSAKYYRLALEKFEEVKVYDQIAYCRIHLAMAYEKEANFKQGFEQLWELTELSDSLKRDEGTTKLQKLEADYLVMKQAQEVELKKLKADANQRILLVAISGALIILIVLLVMGFKSYRLKMKINRTKERFYSMIAHDIRSPFSGILGLAGLWNEEAEEGHYTVNPKEIQMLNQSLNHVYELLENLLQWSQTEAGKFAFDPQVQPLSPLVHEVLSLHAVSAKQKGISLENQIQTGLTARFDRNMVQTVIRNLLSNAIKFSPENKSIFLTAELREKDVVIKVRDEGIGMNREQLNRIFKSDEHISTLGTRNETGTGLGLSLCKNFVIRHGGKIWAESKPGEGTSILFSLPN